MLITVLVEVIPVNAHAIDMPGLAIVRGGDATVAGSVDGNGVLEVDVGGAEVDGHVLPRVAAQRAAGVLVAFVAGVDVRGVDGFVCSSH